MTKLIKSINNKNNNNDNKLNVSQVLYFLLLFAVVWVRRFLGKLQILNKKALKIVFFKGQCA
jgi:hypothetical protein